MTINISGRSGSGKTSVVNHLIKRIGKENICYLHQDSYYKDQSHIPHEERERINYDHPDSIELNLYSEHVYQLANGNSIEKPVYDYTTHTRLKKREIVAPKKIILADGIYVMYLEDMRKMADLNVFVDTDSDLCFIRRLLRDTKERGRSVESVINQYVSTVKPMQDKYVSPAIQYADYIVKGGGHNNKSIEKLITIINKKLNND